MHSLGDRPSLFEAIVETVREPLLALDHDLRVRLANRAFYAAFGTTPEETEGEFLDGLAAFRPKARELRQLVADLRSGQAVEDFELETEVSERGLRSFVLNARRLEHEKDELILLAVEDRTEQVRLHDELERRVAARTADLEAFSYSVSHDLRAPLRALDGFSRALLEDHAEQLPDAARRYLDLIRANANEMGALIDGLLSFSRLGRQALGRRIVDVRPLVEGLLRDLSVEAADRCVRVELRDLPPADADPMLLRQVFANLLSNAYKYTRARQVASIEVGSELKDGQRVWYVRDNGVGFDLRYADKLFDVFQRLHRSDEYEGTGVGLAIARRIVERHGGRIWFDAAPDEGATFFFTLPEATP